MQPGFTLRFSVVSCSSNSYESYCSGVQQIEIESVSLLEKTYKNLSN